MSKIVHSARVSYVSSGVRIDVNLSGMDARIERAQYALDNAIMASMMPYLPIRTGNFRQRTQALSASWAGTGKVCAAAPPYGRYLYMGKVMVERDTLQPAFYIPGVGWRHHKGSKLVAIDKSLTYTNTKTVSMWFDAAKKTDEKNWVKIVKNVIGGAKNG